MINYLERQYLGKNKYSIVRRLVMALFCVIAGIWLEKDGNEMGSTFTIIGGIIVLWSIVLFKILHLQTKIENGFLILEGHWTTRKVRIDLNGIESASEGQ